MKLLTGGRLVEQYVEPPPASRSSHKGAGLYPKLLYFPGFRSAQICHCNHLEWSNECKISLSPFLSNSAFQINFS